MKALFYIILIVGFFIFYQQNPLYAIVIIGIFIAGFIFIKSRKSGSGGGFSRFLSGKGNQQNSNMNDLITIMMLQQLIGDSRPREHENERNVREEQIEKTKQEILDLLDD